MIELTDTTSSAIAAEFVRARTRAGSPAMGMVMTLVVVASEDECEKAMAVAQQASHEHPARVLVVVIGPARGRSAVHARVGTGSGWSGETALIRLEGEVSKHPESVVLPLLLPDSPVAVWWAGSPPESPADDPLGALAQRRITDTATVTRGRTKAVHAQCSAYTRGDTDLSWTRTTPWRALLAAALDQHHLTVTSASVTAERYSPSADLLAAWLADRLKVEVTRSSSSGPGITEAVLESKEGPIRISRPDGRLATYSSPGHPDRPTALKRRDLPELLAEELRHLDEDDVYAATTAWVAKHGVPGGKTAPASKPPATRSTRSTRPTKKAAGPKPKRGRS
ncbi:glucose-6-phosphate dehydrogenase assembly protein OpcA [Nocardioides ferulae]|uniref:glucose-6-phosphate dehydrogenase assembly protein OpcA n=1 Tax=Nocardioides ferulae TaxID=2340821 RepID=UPI000EB4F663|nr:glucose-6-phosphate dehydrogenase assembly protein OpcA [Nocardioides ferulae]